MQIFIWGKSTEADIRGNIIAESLTPSAFQLSIIGKSNETAIEGNRIAGTPTRTAFQSLLIFENFVSLSGQMQKPETFTEQQFYQFYCPS